MRLHRLDFGGIGPFAGTHSIDFKDLTASGLFLLEGPTGAGKSTLIDALVFALYGTLADAGGYDRLRSDHAARDQESFVELVYEVGAGIFKVRRTPRYEATKRRGEGTTTRQATARLWQLSSPEDTTGQVIATKVEEAATEVARTIGLSREQFVQTVVLPQGQFASFLKADNEQRRVLLQRIFGTELYQRLADELRNRRAAADAAQREIAANLQTAVVTLGKAAGLTGDEEAELVRLGAQAALEGEQAELLALADAIWGGARERASAARAAAETAVAAAEAAEKVADQTRSRADLATTKRQLLERLAELEADAPRRAGFARKVRAALRAGPVTPALDAAEQAGRELDAAQEAAADLGLGGSELGLGGSGLDLEALQDALEEAQGQARHSQERLDAAHALGQATAAEAAAGTTLEQAAAAEEKAKTLAGAAAQASERQAQLGPRALEDVERAAQAVVVVREYGAAATALTAALERGERAKRAYEQAQRTEARLREQRMAGIAGEMAASLEDGQACPVCGALEHPNPATLAEDHVDRTQVDAAESRRQAAEKTYEEAAATLSETRASVDKLDGLGGKTDPAEAAQRLAAAKAALAELGEPKNLEAALTKAEAELGRARAALVAAQEAANAAHDRVVEAQSQAGGATVETASADLAAAHQRVDSARQRLQAASRVASAAELAKLTTAGAGRALAEAGFTDASEARAAAMPPGEIERLQSALEKLSGEEASLRQRLAEPALAGVDGDPAELGDAAAKAATALAEAQTAARGAAAAAAVAEGLAKATREAAAEVRQTAEQLAAAGADSAALMRVANLANAGSANLRDVDLPTYVLIRRFEEVIDAANARLGPMS
ncbi:MAG: SMC family ATPase, partial [Bifidobacteriaceae bacterium]|nr:SMC family ATPase [Bifidobacteriaceae bacterium]